MRRILIIFLFIAGACSNKLHHEKSSQKRPFNERYLSFVYDSLLKQHKDYKLIAQDFEEGLDSQVVKSQYHKEVMNIQSGYLISFATSNNMRVRETISRLPDISSVEMLLELRNIEGEIKIQREVVSDGWIKREDFPQLLELAEVDVKMPMLTLLSGTPYGSDCIQEECLLKASYGKTHITIGYEALHMMKLYLKAGGGYPADIRNDLNIIREWYNSGLPREAYKEMLDERMKK